MKIESHGHEHELEPQLGLPERLPAGEHILWQGAPDFRALALRVFHVRKVALYFAVLLIWRAASVMSDGASLVAALIGLAGPLLIASMGVAALLALAWMTARTTVYTLTNKRVVMRIGIVLTLAFNVPLRVVASAAVRSAKEGKGGKAGDIVMALAGEDHMAWLHLWPHVRPWHLRRPQPMLRALPDAAHVAQLLSQAWSAETGIVAQPASADALNDTQSPSGRPTPWQTSPT
jgi:Bacterial PH domain